jgi:AlwI restriction endonuclease
MRKIWSLGNTTVREAKRLKEGLRILVNSPLHGNLSKENEREFAKLLDREGVVKLSRPMSKDVGDMGRKWRSALVQLGFITPGSDVMEKMNKKQRPFWLTSNGKRLLDAKSLPEEQECFLRALLAHQLPSEIETFYPREERSTKPVFSPFRIVLEILASLERKGEEAFISKDEMATIVQIINSMKQIEQAVEEILKYRKLKATSGNVKRFIREYREQVAKKISRKPGTLNDYADSNFRYLKLTGLFEEHGRCLRFSKHKQTIIFQILSKPFEPILTKDYSEVLWNGAPLPTDNAPEARDAIKSIYRLLIKNNENIELPNLDFLGDAELSQLRLQLEDRWFKVQEHQYAKGQSGQWKDILKYLRDLTLSKPSYVPSGESPAYLEWSLWRAFLAMNSLENPPWESRRFKIDQEFLPIHHAPSGGPDLIFEFEDFVIVVEATLTSSSRQEAAEGEPVRRHVADYVDKYNEKGKEVYGMFVANNIDTNTAETFRIGVWYRKDDSKMILNIVPITLTQFADLFEAGFKNKGRLDYKIIKQLIRECLACSRFEAPEWKKRVEQQIEKAIQDMSV